MGRSFFYVHSQRIFFMKLKGLFQHASVAKQLMILLLILLFSTSISSVISMALLKTSLTSNPTAFLQLNQFIAAITIFAFPAIACSYLFSNQIKSYLVLYKASALKCLLVVISMLVITPFISLSGVLNQDIVLPNSLQALEKIFQMQESMMEQLTKQFFAEKTTLNLIRNILLIAITAAITEEFFFRGAILQIIAKTTKNRHIIIWVGAFIFSIFHFQFYGLIPRMLLGAYFGYLLFWSQSILLPIIAHFTNNFIGVLVLSNETGATETIFSSQASKEELLLPAIIGVCLFSYICFWIKKQQTNSAPNFFY